MSALPRPDLPAGPHRDLLDALHDLHHRAGWPSLRRLAADTGVSHTTVSKAFSAPKLPAWGTLELLVEALDGDTAAFHERWLTATAPPGQPTAPRIAGRRAELAAVRRHLETGTGLLLVTGEAGIGKTTLVASAADAADTFVAAGHCLPLSTQVPLLPVADALRRLLDVDDGKWIKEALAECPAFVAASLAPLLPELAVEATPAATTDDYARHLMFTATASLLEALGASRPLAVWFEDLHWADDSSRDLLEHLATGRATIPIVGTWRIEDNGTSPETLEWLMRVRRLPHVSQLEPPPLSREETAEQLALLGGHANADQIDMIHARSQGRPLFTEHLAEHLDDDRALPRQLLDLLDRRLSGLDGDAWVLTRLLGVAARPLSAAQLGQASGLPQDRLTTELHQLRERRLLRTGPGGTAEMQHPLLAEATQRRLVPGEAAGVHRLLATVLGSDVNASPAEVATHWQLAGDATREAEWRVAAAHDSATRFDWTQEAAHWLRALDLWPADERPLGAPPLSRAVVYLAAMDALNESLQWDRAAAMSDQAEAQLPDVDDATRAELLRRAAEYRGEREGLSIGLALIEQALEIYDRLPPGDGLLRAMNLKRQQLNSVGRFDEAAALARVAVETATLLGDRRAERHQLTSLAWYEGVGGRMPEALALLERGRALFGDGSDPLGDLRQAVIATDLLLIGGHGQAEIEGAGNDGRAVAEQWSMDNVLAMMLRSNIATARIRHGQVASAAELVTTDADSPLDPERWPLHAVRLQIHALTGGIEAAAERIELVWNELVAEGEVELEALCVLADIHFWHGTAEVALDRLVRALDAVADSAPVRIVCPVILAGARAAAELTGESEPSHHRDALNDLCARAGLHSFANAGDDHLAAHALASVAELVRADGAATIDHWARAAAAWDRLNRPHDAAYCRWRAAQVALREGQGTVAARLLKKAAQDAREHVPLSQAIAATGPAHPDQTEGRIPAP